MSKKNTKAKPKAVPAWHRYALYGGLALGAVVAVVVIRKMRH